MLYTIQNSFLKVIITTHGGELQSIKTVDGTEYLWQGDSATWPDRAPNIYPYVARLTEGKYTYKGTTYEMDIHGFLKDSEMSCAEHTDEVLVLHLEDNETTRKQYPFSFLFELTYALEGSRLKVSYTVKNKSQDTMYFGLGGHPGFCVPLENGLSFSDYFVQFDLDCQPKLVLFTKDCFVTGQKKKFLLQEKNRLLLEHSLFDNDAVILTDAGKKVHLKSDQSGKSIEMEYGDFDFLGLWQFPNAEVNYLCIEPWSSLPSRDKIIEDLETQDNLLSLGTGCSCTKTWSICIH